MELKELSLQDRERITALYMDVFTREPWNDDWSCPGQLDAYITELAGQRFHLGEDRLHTHFRRDAGQVLCQDLVDEVRAAGVELIGKAVCCRYHIVRKDKAVNAFLHAAHLLSGWSS